MSEPRHQRMSRAHLRRVITIIAVSQLVLALITGATVYGLYRHLNGRIHAGDDFRHLAGRKQPLLPTSALNILVMGEDDRSCSGCGIDQESGEGGSDTTILVHVADGRKSAYAVSIPRDVLVDPIGCTKNAPRWSGGQVQWNQAYARGGPDCTAQQVENTTGVHVDDYVSVNFGGFKDMVDALGGVQVCIPQPIDDPKAHIHFDAGTQTLDGPLALSYVREREAVTGGGDLPRTRRQQAFIASMLKKVESKSVLARPDKLYKFANALAGSVTTSPDLASVSALVKLASSLRGANLDHIKFITAPTTDFPVGNPDWGRLQFTANASDLWKRMRDDAPLGPFAKGAISGHHLNGGKSTAAANGLCA